MSQPDSNQSEPSRMKKLLNGGSDKSPLSRLPKGTGGSAPKKPEPTQKVEPPKPSPKASKPKTKRSASAVLALEITNSCPHSGQLPV